MSEHNSLIVSDAFLPDRLIGSDLLSLVTSGIHTAPLSIYREYIQNAADSIAASGAADAGKVEINIDPANRRVTIRDNGLGLSRAQALQELTPIANSAKRVGVDRGFRGIGRLSGLAFGDSVTFRTRQQNNEPVTSVQWDGAGLRKKVATGSSVEQLIAECVSVETVSGGEWPPQFFQVEIDGIARFAAGSILNAKVVRDYIGEICPVPFVPDFQYASNIANIFAEEQPPLELNVHLNGEETSITRPHGKNGALPEQFEFTEFESISIPAIETDRIAAIGWIAHSSYLGALPKRTVFRGIRARIGNIQIGDETLFDHLFVEDRFNRWCVAEIHVLDARIVPNGKRDYFEPGPHTRNLENQLGAITRKIEKRCRSASAERNRKQKSQAFLQDLDASCELAASPYLAGETVEWLIDKKLDDIAALQAGLEKSGGKKNEISVLGTLTTKLLELKETPRQDTLPGITATEMLTYQKVFHTLIEVSPSPSEAIKTIEAIMERLKK